MWNDFASNGELWVGIITATGDKRAQEGEESIRATFPIHSTLTSTEDFIEGPKAFAEKRKPVWKNRSPRRN